MLKYFKKELDNVFCVLHVWEAEAQNDRDILDWLEKGYITADEARALHRANLEMAGTHF